MAHADACRERMLEEMMEEGDPQSRVKHAIEQRMREGGFAQVSQLIEEIQTLQEEIVCDDDKRKGRIRASGKTNQRVRQLDES